MHLIYIFSKIRGYVRQEAQKQFKVRIIVDWVYRLDSSPPRIKTERLKQNCKTPVNAKEKTKKDQTMNDSPQPHASSV